MMHLSQDQGYNSMVAINIIPKQGTVTVVLPLYHDSYGPDWTGCAGSHLTQLGFIVNSAGFPGGIKSSLPRPV